MNKVIIEKSVSVDVMIEKMESEFEFLNNGWEYDDIKEVVLEGGSGIYEFEFGCRGGLEDFVKNDEYMSIDELVEDNLEYYDEDVNVEDLKEGLLEYYSDDVNFVNEDYDFIKCVSYYEENCRVFVNVVV
jgi:hypothetical protein